MWAIHEAEGNDGVLWHPFLVPMYSVCQTHILLTQAPISKRQKTISRRISVRELTMMWQHAEPPHVVELAQLGGRWQLSVISSGIEGESTHLAPEDIREHEANT